MRKLLLLALSACTLSACHPVAIPEEVVMTTKTTLPASVGAREDLTIGLQVIQGCTFFSKVNVVERDASKLSIQVIGKTQKPCPAVPNAAARDLTFTDRVGPYFEEPGFPERTNPFEIWVNGSKAGTVTVQ